jgi:hypothetical protein
MIRAMVWKELRECRGLVILAVIAAAVMLNMSIQPYSPQSAVLNGAAMPVPFARDSFSIYLAYVGGALAALLGLKQSAWEDRQGVYRYLLYRPISRTRVLAIKAIVGVAVVLIISVGMLLLYARWAATPGNHASPFLWEMTAEAWKVCFVLPIVYLTALLSGVRPANWVGSRLWPLFAGSFAAFFLVIQPWWQLSLAGSLVLSGLVFAACCSAMFQRDF